jgi:hypothetical protein
MIENETRDLVRFSVFILINTSFGTSVMPGCNERRKLSLPINWKGWLKVADGIVMGVVDRCLLPVGGLFLFTLTFTYYTQKGFLSGMWIASIHWWGCNRLYNFTIFACKQHSRKMFEC